MKRFIIAHRRVASALVVLAPLVGLGAVALAAGGRVVSTADEVAIAPYLQARAVSPESAVNLAGIARADHVTTCRGVVTLLAAHSACPAGPRPGN